MSGDYQPIDGNRNTRRGIKTYLVIALLAFIGGSIAMGWAATNFGLFSFSSDTESEQTAAVNGEQPENGDGAGTGTLAAADTSSAAERRGTGLSASDPSLRVAELEQRLARITSQAELASGNATRAESLLIAFAARRAIERGSALGYLEGQLKLRFGTAQPNAVSTIINASRRPVTLDDLRELLEERSTRLTRGAPDQGLWADFEREISTLFTVRREGTPSPEPEKRLERANRYLDNGRVADALAEVERLPNRADARDWMELAQRYIDTQRALDLIETAAILEPQQTEPPARRQSPPADARS